MAASSPVTCPCDSDELYARCCQPLHVGVGSASTAEALMRARYSAYACGVTGYLLRTWHPRTRPEDVRPAEGLVWQSLEITDVVDGGPEDEEGVVAFVARWAADGAHGEQVERSRFVRRGGRWVYLNADDG